MHKQVGLLICVYDGAVIDVGCKSETDIGSKSMHESASANDD